MKMKKLLALLLALCLTLAMVPATAFAVSETSGTCGKNLTWAFDESTGTLTISGYGEMEDYDYYVNIAPWRSINQRIVNIVILEGVTSIGSSAFEEHTSLSSITLPDSLTSIGPRAFSGCTSLNNIMLPDGLSSIEYYTFWGCTSLSSIKLPEGITSIGAYAFEECTSLSSISLPDSLTSIGHSAFLGCTSLSSISLPDGLTSIEAYVFEECTSLSSISLPDSLTSIGHSAFLGCISLSSISLPDGLTSIKGDAFTRCTSLSSISLPEGLSSIENGAFYNCTSLKSIVLPDSLSSIGEGVFYGCNGLESITVSTENRAFSSMDGVLFDKNMTTLVAYPAGRPHSSYVVPDGVTLICNSAFGGCRCLESIELPSGLTSIEVGTFMGCTNLRSIALPNGITVIEGAAFDGCRSLSIIEIPDTVHTIAINAFFLCNSLKDVYYTGSKEEWERINITNSDDGNDPLLNATIHFNSKMPGSKPEEPQPEESETCALDELRPIDYLALSSLSYSGCPSEMPVTIQEYLGNKWDTYWEKTDIKYSELFDHLADWKIVEYSEVPQNGFAAFAFTNDQNEMVVSYRGSQLDDFWNDWVKNDIAMILGIYGKQINDAFNFFGQTGNVNSGKVAVTGHSLGGALAEIVAARNGIKGVSFNSAPFMDIAYGYHPKEMSEKFEGVDNYSITAYVNPDDPIGDWSEEIKPKVHLESNEDWKFDSRDFNNLPHMLPKMVTRDSNGNPCLTKIIRYRTNSSIVGQSLSFFNQCWLQLGTHRDDMITTRFDYPILDVLPNISYGGNGYDRIFGGHANDTFAAGKGRALLDGRWMNDTYYIHKGDGFISIHDAGGADKVILCGFNPSEKITYEIQDNEVRVSIGGKYILSVSRDRASCLDFARPFLNQFTIIKEGETEGVDIGKELERGFFYYSSYDVACPVNIEIYDEATGEVVYTVQDGEVGAYYTDYGNFYVFPENEEGTEFVKQVDLVQGYAIRIVGYDAGTMTIDAYDTNGNSLYNELAASGIEVTPTMVATIEEVGERKNLVIDYDGDGVTDSVVPLAAPVVVSFDANGGTGEMAEVSVAAGGAYELPECGFIAPEGQPFQGWDVNGTVYVPGDKVTVTENVTIKALWSAASGGVTPPSGESGGSQTPPTHGPVPTVTPPSTGGASGSTAAPSTRPTSPNDTPRTGDFSTPALWVCLMAASGLAAAVLARTGKKKRK